MRNTTDILNAKAAPIKSPLKQQKGPFYFLKNMLRVSCVLVVALFVLHATPILSSESSDDEVEIDVYINSFCEEKGRVVLNYAVPFYGTESSFLVVPQVGISRTIEFVLPASAVNAEQPQPQGSVAPPEETRVGMGGIAVGNIFSRPSHYVLVDHAPKPRPRFEMANAYHTATVVCDKEQFIELVRSNYSVEVSVRIHTAPLPFREPVLSSEAFDRMFTVKEATITLDPKQIREKCVGELLKSIALQDEK